MPQHAKPGVHRPSMHTSCLLLRKSDYYTTLKNATLTRCRLAWHRTWLPPKSLPAPCRAACPRLQKQQEHPSVLPSTKTARCIQGVGGLQRAVLQQAAGIPAPLRCPCCRRCYSCRCVRLPPALRQPLLTCLGCAVQLVLGVACSQWRGALVGQAKTFFHRLCMLGGLAATMCTPGRS